MIQGVDCPPDEGEPPSPHPGFSVVRTLTIRRCADGSTGITSPGAANTMSRHAQVPKL